MKHKVLVLCGGGIYGAISSKFLSYLNYDFIKDIDTIAGTSIGGVQSCCYASGASGEEVLEAFVSNGKEIFKKRTASKLNPISIPTYSNDNLKLMLDKFTKNKKVKDIRENYPNLNFIVPTINLTQDKPKVFDNICGKDDGVSLTKIGLMTSSAPTYFPGIEFENNCMIDGGLYDVTGLISSVTCLKGKKDIDFKDMDVLMIGTGSNYNRKPISFDDYNNYNIIQMLLNVIVPYVTLASERAAEYWGNNMGFNSFKYYNPIQNTGKLDNVDEMKILFEDCDMFEKDFIKTWSDFIDN